MANKWKAKSLIDIEDDDIKKSIRLTKKVSRNMYLYYIQCKLLHSRVATNNLLFKMNISEIETCHFCKQMESIGHAFMLYGRANTFCSGVKVWLQTIGYQHFRIEQKTIYLLYGRTR